MTTILQEHMTLKQHHCPGEYQMTLALELVSKQLLKLLILVNYSNHSLHHMRLLDLIHVTLDTEVQVEHQMSERETV